jgi:hypothetical protein
MQVPATLTRARQWNAYILEIMKHHTKTLLATTILLKQVYHAGISKFSEPPEFDELKSNKQRRYFRKEWKCNEKCQEESSTQVKYSDIKQQIY